MNNIRIAKLIMQETGTYNPMYQRPYETHVSTDIFNSIVQKVEQANGAEITGTTLAGVASAIVAPTAHHNGEINIPLGWTERRIRFILEAHVTTRMGSEMVFYFQGFTSHLGVGNNGAIDPNMIFYINSFIRVTRMQKYTQVGLINRDVITDSANVINGQIIRDGQYSANQDAMLMRPQDIFAGMQSAYIRDAYNYHNNNQNIHDTRLFLTGSVRSKKSNNLPCNYVGKIVDSYNASLNNSFSTADTKDAYSQAREFTNEENLNQNEFLVALSRAKGMPDSTNFKLSDLLRIDPNVNAVTNYITLGPARAQAHFAGQTSFWNASDRETLVATILSNSVPAIMMECMISKIYFSSTNHDYTGTMNTVIADVKSLTDADMSSNYEQFKRRFEREVMFDITYGGQDLYMVTINADLFGDTYITLKIGNGPETVFNTPSFCDGLMTPVVTTNKDSYYGAINDFDHLMNNINDIRRDTMINNTI